MNKLVSRNLVLRFKEGKVLKYQNTPGPLPYKKVNTVDGYGIYTNDGGKTFIKSPKYRDWDPNNHINDKNFSKEWAYIPEKSKYAMFQGRKYQRVNDNEYWDITDIKNPKRYTFDLLPFKYALSANAKWKTMSKNPLIINGREIPEISVVSQRSKNGKPSQTGERTTVKTVTPVDNYYLKGFENRKDEIAKLGGVRAVLKMLGFTAGNGLDGKWGQNTEEAYLKYLIANAAKTPSLEDTISAAQNLPILNTPTINPSEYTFTESQLSGLGENPYYEPNPELRFNNFDRTQTRQWLRDNGFNPYSLTGALRKALRMILNGLGTDEDKNLIGLTNGLSEILTNYKYLKQGGNINKLPSRNIVERFKSQRIRK